MDETVAAARMEEEDKEEPLREQCLCDYKCQQCGRISHFSGPVFLGFLNSILGARCRGCHERDWAFVKDSRKCPFAPVAVVGGSGSRQSTVSQDEDTHNADEKVQATDAAAPAVSGSASSPGSTWIPDAIKDGAFVNRAFFPLAYSPHYTSSYDVDTFRGAAQLLWVPPAADHVGGPRVTAATAASSSSGSCQGLPIPLLAVHADNTPGTVSPWLLLYFHGNGEDLGHTSQALRRLAAETHCHCFGVDYPGYGLCAGKATEASILEVAQRSLSFVQDVVQWPSDRIVLVGRSIGSGPATQLAAAAQDNGRPIGGLVLISAFTSLSDMVHEVASTRMKSPMAKSVLGGMASMVVADRFKTADTLKRITCPVLLFHGERDRLIPSSHSAQLFKMLGSKVVKDLVLLPDANHNNVFEFFSDAIVPRMIAWMEKAYPQGGFGHDLSGGVIGALLGVVGAVMAPLKGKPEEKGSENDEQQPYRGKPLRISQQYTYTPPRELRGDSVERSGAGAGAGGSVTSQLLESSMASVSGSVAHSSNAGAAASKSVGDVSNRK